MENISTNGKAEDKLSRIEFELMKDLLERTMSENETLKEALSVIRDKEIGLRDKVALSIYENLTFELKMSDYEDTEWIERCVRASYKGADIFMGTRDSRLEFIFKNEQL